MSRIRFTLGAALCVLLLTPGTARADDTQTIPKLIEQKQGTVVSVKYTLNVSFNVRGQSGEREQSGTTTAVMVHGSGLAMTIASAFDARLNIPPQMRSQVEITSTPSNIRVVFPGSDKEYPAILGAKDTKLGLAFILIKDLEDKKPDVVDFGNQREPKLGERLFGVTRLDQGFDHAAMCDWVQVVGKVTKPRTMWALDNAGAFLAEPLYTADGAVAGICIRQQGVGNDSSTRPFVLPLKVALPTIDRARREAERALEEILEAEEEAAEAAAEEGASEGDGEGGTPEGDGDKPDGDGEPAPAPEQPGGDGDK